MRLKVYYTKELGRKLLDMFEDVEAVVWCPLYAGCKQGSILFYTLTPHSDEDTLWTKTFVVRELENIWYRGKSYKQTLVTKKT